MGFQNSGLLRLKNIIGDPKATPPIEPRIPVCRAAWYKGVKKGHYPQPVKLGPRMVAWREVDIQALENGEWQPEDGCAE
jgi:hypothetical protein